MIKFSKLNTYLGLFLGLTLVFSACQQAADTNENSTEKKFPKSRPFSFA